MNASRPQLRVAIDVQHRHKPVPRHRDRGARFEFSDGTHVHECEIARMYADAAQRALESAGALVKTNKPPSREFRESLGVMQRLPLGWAGLTGWYNERAIQARMWGAHVYLACHVNAGAGAYAMCGHYREDFTGYLLAADISDRLGMMIYGKRGQVWTYDELRRGHSTISHAANQGIPSVLLEPFFGDTPKLEAWGRADGAKQIGDAIASSVHEFWQHYYESARRSGPHVLR